MNKWIGLLRSVWSGVSTHKLRSFLTMLGIVIGVAAVIVLMSVGRGTTAAVMSNFSSLGANTIYISPGFTQQQGVRTSAGSANTLTLEDAEAIANEVSNLAYVAPSSGTSVQVVAGAQNMRTQVTGVTPEYQNVYNVEMAEGNFITYEDYQGNARIAVIGSNVKETLFPDTDAIGQQIRAGNFILTVTGVTQAAGQSITGTADDAILIPLTTLQILGGQQRTSTGGHVVRTIGIEVADSENVSATTLDITALLLERHQIIDPTLADFRVTSIEALLESISSVTNQLTLLLGAIAAISLLVGGIGVMNIMLVSVLERTREIGIRKALGARERDIWMQFLIEAALLTFTGGVIGVVIGWAGAYAITYSGLITTVVSADIVILAVSVSVGIGLFFGFYPAWNASRLDPIKALRSE